MKEYTFSFGNSSTGPVGACLDVIACSEADALEKAKAMLAELEWSQNEMPNGVRVYFNADGLGLDHIECISAIEPED